MSNIIYVVSWHTEDGINEVRHAYSNIAAAKEAAKKERPELCAFVEHNSHGRSWTAEYAFKNTPAATRYITGSYSIVEITLD